MVTNKVNTFTSTGRKLLRHGELLESWKNGYATPLSLQVAPTEYCSLKCKFCSVANRNNKYVFDFDNLKEATKLFIILGTRTVEITGGGDPLLYPKINEYIEFLIQERMQIGIITNGIGINKRISKQFLKNISWIRISANVLDYRDIIEIPEGFNGTLGFSYCWTEGLSTKEQLEKIRDIALKNNVSYIRLVPNCLATKKEQERNNIFLGMLAEEIGPPVFFQEKVFETPSSCYWGYMKPFLYCDEYVYPCSSTVLNEDANKQFNTSYRWCHWSEINDIWGKDITSIIDTDRCEHCVFTGQNEILEYILQEQEHEYFI